MSETNAEFAADQPFFEALLKPHRSLGRTGFIILIGTLVFAWTITGAIFLAHGAWPVFGFFGLDVIGLYIAFRLNYRAALAYEEVSLSRTQLCIRKISPSGKSEQYRFNPFWTRFSIARHAEIGITRMVIETREKIIPIGNFLNPDDRENFATAFARALATAKRG